MSVRTRFAPSPTGRLHLGNVRAAAFNWLFARRHGGAFIVRVEDTDTERNVEDGEAGLLEDLAWLGLDWDEGPDVGGPHAPYRQSQRAEVYADAVERLLAEGSAYRCYCTEEELRERAEVGKEGRDVLRYDGRCRDLDDDTRAEHEEAGDRSVVRFAVPGDARSVDVDDAVFGDVSFPLDEIDDFVLRRADGRVTYNFAVVVDDIAMEISHVIRGVGHLPNTPKQALLFEAFGRDRPVFAHLPTVLGPDGQKLSKRHGAAAVADLRQEGYAPHAVVNYLSLLGWSHPEGEEVLSVEALVEAISLERVGRSDTQIDPDKLAWIGQQHLALEPLAELAGHVRSFVDARAFSDALERLDEHVDAIRSRMSTYGEINEHLPLLYPREDQGWRDARAEVAADAQARAVLEALQVELGRVSAWDSEALGEAIRGAGKAAGAKGRGLFHPIRKALTGVENGPDLGKVLAALGREETARRIALTLGNA